MSTQYVLFVATYAVALMIAALVVLTPRGQSAILRAIGHFGLRLGAGPMSFLSAFGYDPPMGNVSVIRRAQLAENYIREAEEQTLRVARVTLWVLIAGCFACALAAIIIVGILPSLVVSGVWTYDTYAKASWIVVYGTAGGGLAMGAGLIAWLYRRACCVNCTEGCAATRSLLSAVRDAGVSSELAHVLGAGGFPRLRRVLDDL